jgi:ketol-acid reductoisomerase
MYANCSTTAQRGALDWKGKFRDAVAPVFTELYDKVANGEEAELVLTKNSDPQYRAQLDSELGEMRDSELWKAGTQVRSLRPENWKK